MIRIANFIAVFLAFCHFSFGQNAALWVNNPAPRIGDIITIQFRFIDDSLKFVTSINSKDTIWANNGEGSINLKRIITQKGKSLIGPFTFIVNNKQYKSNQIEINVDDKLPNDKEGFWIRQVKWNNTDYLIFEQRIDLTKMRIKNLIRIIHLQI